MQISLGLFTASVFRLKNLSTVKYDKYWEAASSYLCPAGGEREKQAKINTVLVLQHGEVSLWCWLSHSCPLCLPLPGLHCQPLHSQPSWSQSVLHIPLYHVPLYLGLMTIETKTKQNLNKWFHNTPSALSIMLSEIHLMFVKTEIWIMERNLF